MPQRFMLRRQRSMRQLRRFTLLRRQLFTAVAVVRPRRILVVAADRQPAKEIGSGARKPGNLFGSDSWKS
jgi:hypothetical protein